jgi:hypothetical protein
MGADGRRFSSCERIQPRLRPGPPRFRRCLATGALEKRRRRVCGSRFARTSRPLPPEWDQLPRVPPLGRSIRKWEGWTGESSRQAAHHTAVSPALVPRRFVSSAALVPRRFVSCGSNANRDEGSARCEFRRRCYWLWCSPRLCPSPLRGVPRTRLGPPRRIRRLRPRCLPNRRGDGIPLARPPSRIGVPASEVSER